MSNAEPNILHTFRVKEKTPFFKNSEICEKTKLDGFFLLEN